MSEPLGPLLILALALLAANQAFFSQRVFGVFSLKAGKAFWVVLLEWFSGFVAIGILCALLEQRLYGSIYTQDGMFLWICLVLYAVLAFPGYVYRYLILAPQKPRAAAAGGDNFPA